MVGTKAGRVALLVIAMSTMVAGCTLGAAQKEPVDVVGTADLKPTQPDSDAGLVAVRTGFDPRKYSDIAVVQFPVTDSGAKGKDEIQLIVTMPPFLQAELVGRLRAAKLFSRVELVREGNAPPGGEGVLRLEGRITRLVAGDDTSAFVPFSGFGRLADRMKAQIETSLVDARTGQVMVVTADRREAPNSGFQSAELYVKDSFEAMARDLVRFIERLAAQR